jgi:cellulose biosynthesis protein BcsQ
LPELGLPIARTEIPLAAAFQNAAAERLPLLQWSASCPGADAYRDLAAELLEPVPAVAAA